MQNPPFGTEGNARSSKENAADNSFGTEDPARSPGAPVKVVLLKDDGVAVIFDADFKAELGHFLVMFGCALAPGSQTTRQSLVAALEAQDDRDIAVHFDLEIVRTKTHVQVAQASGMLSLDDWPLSQYRLHITPSTWRDVLGQMAGALRAKA